MTMGKGLSVIAITAALSCAAVAEQEQAQTQDRADSSLGEWLELQRSGEQAGTRPTLGGEEMQRIYERYLDSFTHPIPERFRTDD